MSRLTSWLALAASAALVVGCGEDSSTPTGNLSSNQYNKDSAGGDSSMSLDGEAGPDSDVTPDASQPDAVNSCVACSPADIAFDAEGSSMAQVSINVDIVDGTCASFSGYQAPETLVLDDMGGSMLSGSFGEDWTPSEASAGTLTEGGGYWAWTNIPRSTKVSVKVTHTGGAAVIIQLTANEPAFSSITIDDVCFDSLPK